MIKNHHKKYIRKEYLLQAPLLDQGGVGGGNSLITTSPFGHSSSTRRRGNSKTKNHPKVAFCF
jgi:hypothetical protein